ncbi:MAG: Hsp70 family protein [Clostridia bacterium]|nr:Hsp70 family protein [Clostridia bacterium]
MEETKNFERAEIAGETKNRIAGIDLGTTYSCIACMNEMDRPEVIKNIEGDSTTPSVVRLKPGEGPVVGAAAKDTSIIYPEYTIQFVKSRIGKEESFEYGPEDNRLTTTPADVSAEILKKVVRDAEGLSNSEIKDVVITVPAYFGAREKEETKRAGEKAGLNVIDIVEEPTAAAFYYGIQKSSDNETVCIFDLGGGTFDVTAMKIGNSGEEKNIETITTDGDHDLGGKKWDKKFIELVKDKFEEKTGFDGSYDENTEQDLIIECEKKKKQLTSAGSVQIAVTVGQYREVVDITREEFDAATKSLLDSAIELTKEVFSRTESIGKNITKILLVGGSTYMPQVRERLEEEFTGIAIEINEPNEAVAKGACLYAEWKAKNGGNDGNGDIVINLQTIANKSYGVKVDINDEPKIQNLIKKDTKLEVNITRDGFATKVPNQPSVNIQLFQSNLYDDVIEVEDGVLIGSAVLSGIPATGKTENIGLTITMDKSGFITITGELSDSHTPLNGIFELKYNEGVRNK